MVRREVEVLPGKDLLFTWKSKRKLFELVDARTERQFAENLAELAKEDKFDDELTIKMFCIGFNWRKDGPVITPEETENIIEEFCQINGFGSFEVWEKLQDAFCESAIYNKAIVQAGRKLRDQMNEGKPPELPERGSDKGEVGQTSTLTK